MTTVLGIDAAWTPKNPSGVALISLSPSSRWRCLGVASSYTEFMALASGRPVDWTNPATGSPLDASMLLQAAVTLAGEEVSLVTIDMPVSTKAILGRRAADQEISRTFGSRWCSAHSPGSTCPGEMGAALSRQLASLGYPIATTATPAGTAHCLVEVYPHPALLVMLGRNFRVPYKVTNASKYWKGASVRERIGKLLVEFADVARGLKEHIDNIPLKLPLADEVASLSALKRHEDALDALVCCWVGASFMAGKAYPLGDETAAVWCPHP